MPEQGETYAAFIEAQLGSEFERRTSLDARGAAVVTTSAAFAALVFAVSPVITGEDFVATVGSAEIILSLISFLAAGVLGLLANRARKYTGTAVASLVAMTEEHWTDDETDARNIVARRNVKAISSLREGNRTKARQISCALIAQLIGIAALAWGMGQELWSSV